MTAASFQDDDFQFGLEVTRRSAQPIGTPPTSARC